MKAKGERLQIDGPVAVVGLGKSNTALCRYLVRHGCRVTVFDQKDADHLGASYRELSDMGCSWSLGEGYLEPLPGFPTVFLTPGMKKDLPQIRRARQEGAKISCEMDLFMTRCKGRVIGVTGSAGKTTVVTMLGSMLRDTGPVYVGGNIGNVLIEQVDDIEDAASVVLELSSFQLELVTVSPHVSLLLNIQPNHLDVHETFEDYVRAKKQIFRYQGEGDWCLLNLDDAQTRGFSRELPGEVGFFSLDERSVREALASRGGVGAWLKGSELVVNGEIFAVREELRVPGLHNVSNALAAALAAFLAGVDLPQIGAALRSFAGVPHRIEHVRTWNGMAFYDDSIATSPDRTLALMGSLEGPLVLILGGYDKNLPFDDLAREVVRRGSAVVTLGAAADKIEGALSKAQHEQKATAFRVTRAASLEDAVEAAVGFGGPGFSIALSPACASYDMFPDYVARGEAFKAAVKRLK